MRDLARVAIVGDAILIGALPNAGLLDRALVQLREADLVFGNLGALYAQQCAGIEADVRADGFVAGGGSLATRI